MLKGPVTEHLTDYRNNQGFLSQNITNAELSTITVFRPIANANLAITGYIKLSLSIDAIVYRKQNIADSFIYFQLHGIDYFIYFQLHGIAHFMQKLRLNIYTCVTVQST